MSLGGYLDLDLDLFPSSYRQGLQSHPLLFFLFLSITLTHPGSSHRSLVFLSRSRRAHARTTARGWPSSPAYVKGGNQHQAFRRRGTCTCCCLFCRVAAQVGFGKQEREREEGSYPEWGRDGVQAWERKGESKGGKRGAISLF